VTSRRTATLPLAGGGLLLLFTRPYLALILPVAAGLGASRMAAWSLDRHMIVALGIGLTWHDWKTTGNSLMTKNLDPIITASSSVPIASPLPDDVMRRMYSEEFQLQPFSAKAIRKYIVPTISGAPDLITLASLPWLFRNRRVGQATG
jgi:hypothetical protein